MRFGDWPAVCCLVLLAVHLSSNAAQLKDCLNLVVSPSGDASLINTCTERLNVTYCIDNPKSAKDCSREPLGITTLGPGGADPIHSYVDHGAGAVYWAVCAYPEAAVHWKPGTDSPYECR